MTSNHPGQQYIYYFNYDIHYHELCQLESRQIFGKEAVNKFLFSDLKVDPSISPFIKSRFQVIASASNYFDLLKIVINQQIKVEGFKVEYLMLEGDEISYEQRLQKLKGIGYSITGEPDYVNPSIIYAICQYQMEWYFGVLIKHDPDWKKHNDKPCSFSNSMNMNIAKTLVSLASQGKKSRSILDACCGVGTIMLEACIAGINIEGCDINWKACKHARQNLAFYNYTAEVYRLDIKGLDKKYDAAIIDLPYNLYSYSNDEIALNIVVSAAQLSPRLIIVSITDISEIITEAGLIVSDFCKVEKRGKSRFTRSIWVCVKD